jgi:uncharacterized membrane protein
MDFSYLSDWLNLLFRWLHLIFGAAWIGTSFYFNWLNNHVREPERDTDPLVGGEVWSVHGGHFYRVVKYKVAPEQLPKTLHWFKWEAYLTWVTGICLLAVVYYLQADFYLIDQNVADITTLSAIGLGIGTLVGGWLVYHYACKSPLVDHKVLFTVVMFAAITGVAYGLTQFLSARAAYIHVGALLGTCMALNVFFVIIPNQRVMVDAMIAGKEPDGALGRAGALRSLHNNYMTLPVLFIMLSNHFPMTFGHSMNWAVLAAIGIVGAATRHWFNLAGRGIRNPWLAPAAAGGLVALVFVMSPYADTLMHGGASSRATPVTFSEANQIIVTRCTPCHATKPTYPGFVAPPKGIIFESAGQIKAQLPTIEQVAVTTITMPLGNLTQMTDEERSLLRQWIAEGATTSD